MNKKEKLLNKVLKYQRTKDMNLREEIILENLDFADRLCNHYSKKYYTNIDDLKSYCYEGLILGIDTYSEDTKCDIIQYLYYEISNAVRYGLQELKGFNSDELEYYIEARKEVEKEYGSNLEEIPGYVNQLVEDMLVRINSNYKYDFKKYEMSSKVFKDVLGDLSINDKKTRYELNKDNYLMDLTNYDNILLLKELKENIMKSCHKGMNEFEQATLITYFGLEDGVGTTLRKLGKKFNVSHQRAQQVQEKAFRKMRYPSRARNISDSADFVADHDYYRR